MTFHRAATAACVLMLLASPSLAEDAVMGRYDARQLSYTPEKIELPVALKWEYTGNKFKNNPAAPTMTVDLSFYDTIWYREITTGTDAQSCFNDNNGVGADPPRRRGRSLRHHNRPPGQAGLGRDQSGDGRTVASGPVRLADSCLDTLDIGHIITVEPTCRGDSHAVPILRPE